MQGYRYLQYWEVCSFLSYPVYTDHHALRPLPEPLQIRKLATANIDVALEAVRNP